MKIALAIALCLLLFTSGPGLGAPTIAYDDVTHEVTVRLGLRDFSGLGDDVPERSDLAVFENGVPQADMQVELERLPVAVAALVEMSGGPDRLRKALATEAAFVTRPLFKSLRDGDRLGVFAYDDRLHTLIDFDSPRDRWDGVALSSVGPGRGPSKFHDAVVASLALLEKMPGRKALFIVSTGVDEGSRTGFDEVVAKAAGSDVSIFALGLGRIARDYAAGGPSPLVWHEAERRLQQLAVRTAGRALLQSIGVEAASVYETLLERVRVGYVLRYEAKIADPKAPRTVEIRVMDGRAAVAGTSRRPGADTAVARATYFPATASEGSD